MKQTINWLKLTFVFLVLSGCTQSELMVTVIPPPVTSLLPTSTTTPIATEIQGFIDSREVITAENASQVEELYRLGYGGVRELNISPDDSMLAVASTTGVQVYDLTTFEFLFGNMDNWSDSIDWSPDSSQLVSGHFDGSLNVWDVETGIIIATKTMYERIWSTAWSPNGRDLASSSSTELTIWETEMFENTQTVQGNFQYGITWTEDSKNIIFHSGHAVGVVTLDNSLVINNYRDANSQSLGGGSYINGSSPGGLVGLYNKMGREVVNGDGHSKTLFRIATSSVLFILEGALFEYDIATKETAEIMKLDAQRFSTEMDWNSDMTTIISGGTRGGLFAIDLLTGETLGEMQGYYCCLGNTAVAPGGTRVAYSNTSDNHNLYIWDLKNQVVEEGKELTYDQPMRVGSISWPKNGTLYVSNGLYFSTNEIFVWNGLTGETLLDFGELGKENSFPNFMISPDGSMLVAKSYDPDMDLVIDIEEANISFRRMGTLSGSTLFSWSADSQLIAISTFEDYQHGRGDDRYGFQIWQVETNSKIAEWEVETTDPEEFLNYSTVSLAVTNSGNFLAGRNRLGDLFVWQAKTGKDIHAIELGKVDVYSSVSWSPRHSLLVYDMPEGLIIWDPETQREVAALSGFSGGLVDIVWSADGTQIATVGEDDTIRIWGIP